MYTHKRRVQRIQALISSVTIKERDKLDIQAVVEEIDSQKVSFNVTEGKSNKALKRQRHAAIQRERAVERKRKRRAKKEEKLATSNPVVGNMEQETPESVASHKTSNKPKSKVERLKQTNTVAQKPSKKRRTET